MRSETALGRAFHQSKIGFKKDVITLAQTPSNRPCSTVHFSPLIVQR